MASRPSMVAMPFLLIVASSMAMLVSSKIAKPEMTKIATINLPQLSPNQLSDEKMFDIPGLQQCWASFSRIGGCIDEINLVLRGLESGGGGKDITGLMGPVCCDVFKVMHEICWPQMLPDPFFIKINFYCAHHHHSIPKRPTPVGPPPSAPQVSAPAPAPAPQYPSPAPAPQDPLQSPAPPQYSYPTPPAPQDPLPSPTTPQYPLPIPPGPQDPLPSPTTPQYPSPTPPGHGAQP